MATDRIEKHVILKAPRHRVWDALTDSRQFGAWFGMELTESGFDALPPERRDAAFRANDGGWTKQCDLVAAYLARHT